jgi:hypothetical protein
MKRTLRWAGPLMLASAMAVLGWLWWTMPNADESVRAPAAMRETSANTSGNTPGASAEHKAAAASTTPSSHVDRAVAAVVTAAVPEDRASIVRREIDARLEILATAHAREQSDPLWSARAESLLTDIAGSPDLPQTQAVRVQCKRSLCVAEYATASPDEYQSLAEHMDIGGTEGYFVETPAPPGDSARHLLVYLARPGYSLPAM